MCSSSRQQASLRGLSKQLQCVRASSSEGAGERPRLFTPRQRTQPQQPQPEQLVSDGQPPWWRSRPGEQCSVHAYWDLDNLQPVQWSEAEATAGALRAALRPLGRLRSITAYANPATLTWQQDKAELLQLVDAGGNFRCELCGRNCASFDELRAHFKQLHEREHAKKLAAPPKVARKYAESPKAQRVRELQRRFGSNTKSSRSGRTGQMLRVLLQRAGVDCHEVSREPQAADKAIQRHVQQLAARLHDGVPPGEEHPQGGRELNEAVLVLASDDRGFAACAARWLRMGGAGVVLVSSRAAREWLPPLKQQLRAQGCGEEEQEELDTLLRSVACLDWAAAVASAAGGGTAQLADDDNELSE